MGASLLKLMVLPLLGIVLFRIAGQAVDDYLSALILLASPTATIAYVMAREMGADAEFAVAAISATTLFSAVTFSFWLSVGYLYLRFVAVRLILLGCGADNPAPNSGGRPDILGVVLLHNAPQGQAQILTSIITTP